MRKKTNVVGFDLNKEKIVFYKSGVVPTKEVGDKAIKATKVQFTSNEEDLRRAKFHIDAVPSPVYDDHTPDLTPVEGASKLARQPDKRKRRRFRVDASVLRASCVKNDTQIRLVRET